MSPRAHDRTYWLMLSHPVVFIELLMNHCGRWIVPALLRPDDIQLLSGSHVTDEGSRLRQDIVWKIGYGDSHLVCAIEFQSSRHDAIEERICRYGRHTEKSLIRGGWFDRHDTLPHMLAIVLYNGADKWEPRGSFSPEGPPPGPHGVASDRLSAWSPFLFIDMKRLAATESHKDTMIVRMALLESEPSLETVARVWDGAVERYTDPRDEELRRHFQLWINERIKDLEVPPELVDPVQRLEEGEKVITAAQRYLQKRDQESRAEGEHRTLARLAGKRFGPEAETELAAMLKGQNGQLDLSAVMDTILDSPTKAEMVAGVGKEIAALA